MFEEIIYGLLVIADMKTLIIDLGIRLQAELIECLDNLSSTVRLNPGRIDIIYPNKPLATISPSLQVACQSSCQ